MIEVGHLGVVAAREVPLVADGGVVIFVVGLVCLGAFIAIEAVGGANRRRAWSQVATELGLDHYGPMDYGGRLGESEVRMDVIKRGSGKNRRIFTRFRAMGELPGGLSIGKEGFFSRLTEDIKTGDASFDTEVRVTGDEGLALALLDDEMRARLKDSVVSGWHLKDGTWTLLVQRRIGDAAVLEGALRRGATLADATRRALHSVPDRLCARVSDDVIASARKVSLQYLIAHHGGSAALDRALDVARGDADAGVRLVAATTLGDTRLLTDIALDGFVDPEHRAQALMAAVRLGHAESIAPALDGLLAQLADGVVPIGLLSALAAALGMAPHADAEATLLRLVDHENEDVKLAAIRSLGKVGSLAAVPALVPLRDRFFAFAIASAGAAKEAILQIQARAGGGEAGALSLAEADGGLAVVEVEHEESR